MSGRRDRSRSPVRGESLSRRRDPKNSDGNKTEHAVLPNVMNQMMMANMYPQAGNMMMGGMYNMMMPNSMMGGSLMPNGIDMMSSTGMEVMAQPPLDMTALAAQPMAAAGSSLDMTMMGGVMMDPSMMAMYPNMATEITPEKKEINLKYSKLLPPLPGAHQPPRRAKPPGCRTIFVSGLPDKIREKTLGEIFERYGRIQILRLSKKNFCHIRFDRETCVDAAMSITGYRIKLKDKDKDEVDEEDDSHATNGFLHVDYALSRDDQNEYERRQRQAYRVQQQQMQELSAQQEAMTSRPHTFRRSPSPIRIQPFSNAAVVQMSEKIKTEEHFSNTLPTLIAWLERGECSKRNSNQFYSMIQATNSHIRRLFNEKVQCEEELQECRERIKTHIQHIIDQLEQVAKVFIAATHQRVWDHFTKPQRKNIETWQKMTQEFNSLKEEFNEKFLNDDSDANGYGNKAMTVLEGDNEEVQLLKRENESLQFQLEAYKNEVDVIKADAHKEMEKFKAQFIARQALQEAMEKNPPLPSPVAKPPPPPPLPDDVETKVAPASELEAGCGEAKLIGVMSAFLQVHPQGASLDYVVSYVRALFPAVSQASIHLVLQKHADVFARRTSGVGANIDSRWHFVAFHSN